MVSAMNTGFSTESLIEEDTNTFLSNVNISVLTEEPQKKTIKVFDINDDGRVAIGYNTSGRKSIGVYTSDGTFQYAYEFNCSGDFGVEWDNDSLIIYFVRSNIAIAVDSEGEIKSALRIQDTLENNYYWRNSVFITERIHGDTKYTLENDMGLLNVFASSYSQLVVTKNNGEKMIFYDVNNSELLRMLAKFIAIIVFVCIIIFIVLRQFSKKSINTEGSPNTGDG